MHLTMTKTEVGHWSVYTYIPSYMELEADNIHTQVPSNDEYRSEYIYIPAMYTYSEEPPWGVQVGVCMSENIAT